MPTETSAEIKKKFYEDNHNCVEIKASDAQIIGGFDDIDEDDEEIWLLQCPKGFKIKELENQKLKLPGKMEQKNFEAAAILARKRVTFGYANRKHHYSIKNVPIAGEIIISEQIEDAEQKPIIDLDEDDNVPEMPESIIRHPLFGAQFEKYLKMDDDVQKRLNSIRDHMAAGITSKTKIKTEKSPGKRKHTSPSKTEKSKFKLNKTIKIEKEDVADVEEDLKWIKQI